MAISNDSTNTDIYYFRVARHPGELMVCASTAPCTESSASISFSGAALQSCETSPSLECWAAQERVIEEAEVEIISAGLLGFVGRSMLSRLPLQRIADESRTGSGLRLEGMLHRARRSTLWC